MYLAVDIGATKVLLAVFTNKGKLEEQLKFPTPEKYLDLVEAFKTNVSLLKNKSFERAVVAVPGRLNRERGIALAFGNRPWLNVPIEDDFRKIINCPIRIENDAKLAALSEANLIKDDFKRVLYVTISTGISSGLIVDGIIDHGMQDSEAGQMWFDYHGKRAQWEDFASGRAIVAKYGKRASEITDPGTWHTIAHNIAIGLIELISVIQPEIVVLGGGVGTHFDKYKKLLKDELSKYELPIVPIPPIVKARNPEEAVIYGCLLLAREDHAKITH